MINIKKCINYFDNIHTESSIKDESHYCSNCGNLIEDLDYYGRDDVAGVPVCRCKDQMEKKRSFD